MAKYTEKQIHELLEKRILVLDGAMGTMLQQENLTEEDFGGPEYVGCNEHLLVSKPEVIKKVHRAYLEAGADIIETDSFGTTPIVLEEYGLQDKAYEFSKLAARIAREVADEYDTPEEPRLVAGSMGPTTKAISLTGGVTFEELVEGFYIQAKGLMDGGADLFLVETAQDTLNLKAALIAILKLQEETGVRIPYMVSGTIEPMGTMLAGQGVESMVTSLEHFKPLSFGLNCGTGPDFMKDHIHRLSDITDTFVSVYPNAGMPDEEGHYHESPASLAEQVGDFADHGWVNIVGGCCGTSPDHIRALKQMALTKKPQMRKGDSRSRVSGIDFLPIEDDERPYIVGERTNSLGSKLFREMIAEGKYNEAAEIARRQVKAGAHVIDVCLQNAERDELEDMKLFLPLLLKKIKAPVMIDSTKTEVLEWALKQNQGKILYNSVNLENGEDRFEEIAPLYHKFGFALVVGTIDDDPEHGMGVTVQRKLEIAEKSYKLLVEKYGIDPKDIIFDPLVFPVGTGDEDYIGSARATIEGTGAIKKRFPECRTILGISNVSFGLPVAGREILNAVFIHHNVEAGLDYAIANAEKYIAYEQVSEEECKLAEDLIFHTKETYAGALERFTAHFKEKKASAKKEVKDRSKMTVRERLAENILEGSIEGLNEDLDLALKEMKPLEVVNGPLMDGMAVVGKLFGENKLIVAEVLQSAEVMKAAVGYLEQFMEAEDSSTRAKFLLATVKGDVHDIGKNLVDIILSNNGYKVLNVGIKVPPEEIIRVYNEEKPDVIGLSGLLVKSAEQMVITAEKLKEAGIQVPILVGGAALSEKFARKKIKPGYDGAVIYSRDAMSGLEIMNRLTDDRYRDEMIADWSRPYEEEGENVQSQKTNRERAAREKLTLTYDWGKNGAPNHPVDLKGHRLRDVHMDEIFKYVNPGMLYKKHLGFSGNTTEALKNGDPKFLELKGLIDELEGQVLNHGLFRNDGYYQFFRAASHADDLVLLSSDGKTELERFHFPRQNWGWELCISDFVAPLESGIEDYVSLFVVTTGVGVREEAEKLKQAGQYLKSHALSALALESAEGFAEYLHIKLREQWGIPDKPGLTPRDMFGTKYQGRRFSFGYAACPDLADQEKLFRVLNLPGDFGVQLTEGFSMDPEASVSAVVFAHPEARYFSVEEGDD